VRRLKKELIQALNELQNLEPTAINPHFASRYTPLAKVLEAVKPVLQKHGLAISQKTKTEVVEGKIVVFVKTQILDESGVVTETEWTGLEVPNDGNSAQKAGAVITYLRRYTLASILAIATDEDDDANSAGPVENGLTEKQLALLKRYKAEKIAEEKFGKRLEELTKAEASAVIDEIKKAGGF
jgi:hypothetical protein